jgi:hypothetical protein
LYSWVDVNAVRLRKNLPLLLERVGVRRKNKEKCLLIPLILTFSRWEKGLSFELNDIELMLSYCNVLIFYLLPAT